jgi:glutamyl-tRNA reductase
MLDSLGLLGISWRHASADVLAQFTLPREERGARLRELAAALEVDELLYLATCNRVEVVFSGGAPIGVAERRRRLQKFFAVVAENRALRAWDGDGAVEHLYLVASGLDSARAGESEIMCQLKTAAAESEGAGLLRHHLGALVQDALQMAKRVSPVTYGHIGRASLADIALEHVMLRLAAQPGAVALVGVSPMIVHCATTLAARGVPLVMVNRTRVRAQEIAPLRATVRSLDDFRLSPDEVSAVILATASTEPIFSPSDCLRLAQRGSQGIPPLVVDLSLPASLRAADAQAAGMAHVGMDRITRAAEEERELALEALGGARAIVDAALDERRTRAWTELVNPTIIELRRRYADRAQVEVERVLASDLSSLDATQREVLRRWAAGLSHHFAHVPSRGLRDLAATAGPEAAADFLEAAAPDLAKALRARIRA